MRIVLVQTIGLVAIAALIGGGGLGTFIFQGIGQTAIDLVLLGAIPIVALAFWPPISCDALAESSDAAHDRTSRPSRSDYSATTHGRRRLHHRRAASILA